MRKASKVFSFPNAIFVVIGLFPLQAYAYLDPGTGCFMLLAGLRWC